MQSFFLFYFLYVIFLEKLYNKLVRDNIPEIIKKDNRKPIYHELSSDEYWEYLLEKDKEELLEVRDASTKDEIKMELADKLEIIRAMAKFHGYTLNDIIEEADKKRSKNGAFDNRLFLEKVIIK